MTQAINSGAINETSFPGAEEGVSLVQMIGTVQIVCTMTTITLLLGATAATQAKASVSAVATTAKLGIPATTEAKAVPAEATALRKTKVGAQASTATAFGAQASAVIKARLSAETNGVAATSVVSINKASLGASGLCSAQTSTPPAANYVYRAAVLNAFANTNVLAYIERPVSASTVARCVGVGQTAFIRNISASTVAQGVVSSGVYNKKQASAAITPTAATSSIQTVCEIQISVATAPGAYSPAVFVGLNRRVEASATATAVGRSSIVFKLQAQATTTARAIASSAAADYGIAMPAPAERLMFVQASERNMEVTA